MICICIEGGHLTRQYIPVGNSSAELTDDWQNIFVKEQYNLIDCEDQSDNEQQFC